MKIKTNIRAGSGANSGGVNSGGVSSGGGGAGGHTGEVEVQTEPVSPPPPPVVYYPPGTRCAGY